MAPSFSAFIPLAFITLLVLDEAEDASLISDRDRSVVPLLGSTDEEGIMGA